MIRPLAAVFCVTLAFVPVVRAQVAPVDAAALKEAQQLESDGKHKEALTAFRRILEKHPAAAAAHLGVGRVLDLEGQYAEARGHLQKAIDSASDQEMNGALSAMAISHAFEGRAAEAARFYQRVFDRQVAAGTVDFAGGTANAIGRVYLETGDAAAAEKWYRTGYDTAMKNEKRTPEQTDLTEMRWRHAQARIAARRSQFGAARTHVDEIRTLVGRGRLDAGQTAQLPHVAGYVAFYEGDVDKAIAELSQADAQDPFVLGLLAQAHERKQQTVKARELYARILQLPGHSLQAAIARPLAARRLAAR